MEYPKFCIECGMELEKGSVFCSNCGTKVEYEGDEPKSTERAASLNQKDRPSVGEDLGVKATSAKRFPVKVIITAIVIFVLISVAVAYLMKIYNNKGGNGARTEANSSAKARVDIKNPSTYISAVNKKYTYYAEYTDGTTQTFDVIAGKLAKTPVLTVVTIIPESEAMTQHFVKRKDGLYVVDDTNANEASMYLPNELTEGKEWVSNGVKNKILKTNETCDLGFRKFENCLKLEQKYEEAGYTFHGWYAPGVGMVKSIYAESGKIFMELKAIADMPKANVEAQLTKFSPNIDKVK